MVHIGRRRDTTDPSAVFAERMHLEIAYAQSLPRFVVAAGGP